jgi:hypothetical protein
MASPVQRAVDVASSNFGTAPAGATLGGALGAGVYLSTLVSVEGELGRTRLMEREQRLQNLNLITSERRRDNTISLLLRMHLPAGGHLALEPVGGLVISVPQSSYQITESNGSVDPKYQRDMPVLIGAVMGIDARVGTGRLAIVPSLRIRVTGGNPQELDPKGLPRWTITPGVAARVGFDHARGGPASRQKPTYVSGEMGLFDRPAYVRAEGPPDSRTGPTGRTTAFTVGGGIFLHPHVAMDISFVRSGVMAAHQSFRYGNRADVELRDNFLTTGARVRIPVSRLLVVEPVAAFMLVFHEGVSQSFCCYLRETDTPTADPRRRDPVPVSPGVAVGVDVPIGKGPAVLVPSLRMFFAPYNLNRYYDEEYTRVTFVPGVGVRMRF